MSAYKDQTLKRTGSVHHPVTDQSAPGALSRPAVPALQKKGPGEELPTQGKFAAQLAAAPEEEEPMQKKSPEEELPKQGKFVAQLAAGPEEEEPAQKKGADTPPAANRTGMPDTLKSGVENLSGMAMDDVKVHYNSSRPSQLNALAYAQGTDIHIGPGQEKHLPHEAWHVVQQKEGRVKPTMQMKEGTPVNDDPGLEKEADEMGAKALR